MYRRKKNILNTKAKIQARIVECVGGRAAAEEIVFNSITTGAANDIEQATKMARAMITQYGMSDKFGMVGLESPENQYLSGRNVLNCSDQTATEIDREVMKIIKEAYEEALKLLRSHRKALDEIAAFLIEKETITGKEFMEIFHEVERREEEAEQTDVSENVDEKVEAAEQQTEAQDDGVVAVKDQSAEPTEHTETEITGEEAQQK